ncbi:JK_71P [Escherichia phage Jk06]|uniref:JK_71P n=1 Tax=Escherichia phage Jk06 TaxID=2886922 RepID=Q45PU4_9CAUD|nr:hypothetical protein JK_71 [Escherichia phage Jk06]AAZ29321.1 JK_71P [Escherichia phage Jk06]
MNLKAIFNLPAKALIKQLLALLLASLSSYNAELFTFRKVTCGFVAMALTCACYQNSIPVFRGKPYFLHYLRCHCSRCLNLFIHGFKLGFSVILNTIFR